MMPSEEQTYRSFLEKRLDNQDTALGKILEQTTKHNGRLTKVERYLIVLGTAISVLIILKFPQFSALIGLI